MSLSKKRGPLLIRQRLREGFTQEQLCEVIESKLLDDHFINSPHFYRPQTLFGSKCEGYVQALNGHPMQGKITETTVQNMKAFAEFEKGFEKEVDA